MTGRETVEVFMTPGPAVDEVNELEEATELCRAIVKQCYDEAAQNSCSLNGNFNFQINLNANTKSDL